MTDWKARCAELLQAIDDDVVDVADGPRFQAAVERTRAELVKPEPQGLTVQECNAMLSQTVRVNLEAVVPDIGVGQ